MAYTKLFQSIITSTIWMEDDKTRIVWITMLALADRYGEVTSTIPGLARLAGVSIEATNTAISAFLSPDKYSRTADDEGRRVEAIPSGWLIVNHGKYRDMASREDGKNKNAARQKRFRERQNSNEIVTHSNAHSNALVTPNDATITHDLHIAEAEAEAKDNTSIFSLPVSPTKKTGKAPKPQKEQPACLLRAKSLLNIRPTTQLDKVEAKAWLTASAIVTDTADDDWTALQTFYAAPQKQTYARKGLAQLLNNWGGEITRAHCWVKESKSPKVSGGAVPWQRTSGNEIEPNPDGGF